jgi:hypothetical protein
METLLRSSIFILLDIRSTLSLVLHGTSPCHKGSPHPLSIVFYSHSHPHPHPPPSPRRAHTHHYSPPPHPHPARAHLPYQSPHYPLRPHHHYHFHLSLPRPLHFLAFAPSPQPSAPAPPPFAHSSSHLRSNSPVRFGRTCRARLDRDENPSPRCCETLLPGVSRNWRVHRAT